MRLRRAWQQGLGQTAASGELVDQSTVLNALAIEEVGYGNSAVAMTLAGALG